MFEDNTARNDKFHRPIIDRIGLARVQLHPSVQSSYRYQNILRIGEVLGHRIDAKISPKAASENAQTTVSENRYTNPIIDVFRTVILSLLASTGSNVWASFLVHQVPRASTTVLRYRRVFTQFSLRVRVSDYTRRPMIADLLYLLYFSLSSGCFSKVHAGRRPLPLWHYSLTTIKIWLPG